jgi:hypothetical protein
MTRLLVLMLLLLPIGAHACPNVLIGDSLAQGMAPFARADGYQVIARRGAGLMWLRGQAPRCVGTLVIVIGTNDLSVITEAWAPAYVRSIAEVVRWWDPRVAIWATPGCFPTRPAMDRESAWLNATAEPSGRMGLHRGRSARCSVIRGDGIHPPADVYGNWWRALRPSRE